MPATAVRPWVLVFALAAACALPSRVTMAGGGGPSAAPPAASDRDRAMAAALESSNLRMRAKLEEAAILDRQGRHDEALVALKDVEAIHREGMVLVQRLTTPTGPAVVEILPSARVLAPGIDRPRAQPQRTVVDVELPEPCVSDATEYLIRAQRLDGWFRSGTTADAEPGADLDAGHDIRATALAVVALLDTLDDDLKPHRSLNSAIRGVEALLGAQDVSGAFGDGKDLESQALASWAVAAGAARLPHAPWRPTAARAISNAVTFSLLSRDARGLWRAGTGSANDDWVVSAWMAIALHEIAALPRAFSRDVDLDVVLENIQESARKTATPAADAVVVELGASARFARELLTAFDATRDDDKATLLPMAADDEVSLLLGTTLRFSRSYDFATWQRDVLLETQHQQRHGGAFSGSWNPKGPRARARGRTYVTACNLLAALVPVTPFREPAAD